MRKDLVEIVMVVDRSGSMMDCCADAEGGINAFITEQKAVEGDANFTLVQFDTEYEFVHVGTPIKKVPQYVLRPRGYTALLDAVGRAISETGERLAKMDESERPATVIVVIVTDGEENSSKEFTLEKVREMITHQRENYSWHFNFLGADDTAFAQASQMGISAQCAAVYNTAAAGTAHRKMSDKISHARGMAAAGLATDTSFSAEDREDLAKD
jgi:Mg-chelatase subunit ChlD